MDERKKRSGRLADVHHGERAGSAHLRAVLVRGQPQLAQGRETDATGFYYYFYDA